MWLVKACIWLQTSVVGIQCICPLHSHPDVIITSDRERISTHTSHPVFSISWPFGVRYTSNSQWTSVWQKVVERCRKHIICLAVCKTYISTRYIYILSIWSILPIGWWYVTYHLYQTQTNPHISRTSCTKDWKDLQGVTNMVIIAVETYLCQFLGIWADLNDILVG